MAGKEESIQYAMFDRYKEGMLAMSYEGYRKSEVEGMSDEIMGYYRERKEALLKEFDRTTALMKDSLVARYGIQHCSVEPDSPLRSELLGCQFKPEATPIEGEPVFKKTVNSAFIGTELESYLRDNGIEHIVIVGLTTDHCDSITTRMAGNLGFKALLISDATATFDRKDPDEKKYMAEDIHALHIASLNGEFCNVITTDILISA